MAPEWGGDELDDLKARTTELPHEARLGRSHWILSEPTGSSAQKFAQCHAYGVSVADGACILRSARTEPAPQRTTSSGATPKPTLKRWHQITALAYFVTSTLAGTS